MSDKTQIGLVSDVHANATALEAVLDDMPPVDVLIHAGDVIGYGPSPNECINLLQEHEAESVRGNHDEALFGGPVYESGDKYAQRVVTEENREWVGRCPAQLTLFDGQLKVIHGNPTERFQYTYPSDFEPGLLGDEEILVLGHTHKQSKAAFDDGIIVNPGSVGQPRDGDKRAAYAVVDLTNRTVTLDRVDYDINRVATAIRNTSISPRNAQRLERGQ
jgi:putative phosphoesterase